MTDEYGLGQDVSLVDLMSMKGEKEENVGKKAERQEEWKARVKLGKAGRKIKRERIQGYE